MISSLDVSSSMYVQHLANVNMLSCRSSTQTYKLQPYMLRVNTQYAYACHDCCSRFLNPQHQCCWLHCWSDSHFSGAQIRCSWRFKCMRQLSRLWITLSVCVPFLFVYSLSLYTHTYICRPFFMSSLSWYFTDVRSTAYSIGPIQLVTYLSSRALFRTQRSLRRLRSKGPLMNTVCTKLPLSTRTHHAYSWSWCCV